MSPARTLMVWLIGSRIPGGLDFGAGLVFGGVVTPGYASCCGSPAASLALARRGLLAVVRLRRTFPSYSLAGQLIAGLFVFKNKPELSAEPTVCRLPAADFPKMIDGWIEGSRVCRFPVFRRRAGEFPRFG